MNARLPEVSPVPARLALLRGAMAREDLAAYLVPSADPHLSEYLPERWQARRWLSGFTGSVGTLVVTADFAGLWVDSRYWVQADAELAGTGVQLMKMTGGQQSAPHVDWLAQNVPAGATVGVDGAVLGVAAARGLTAALSARGIALRTDLDLLDAIWPERRGCPATRCSSTRRRRPTRRARASWPRCVARCTRRARSGISCRPSTISRGCSTCAAPTSTSIPCSLRMQ